MLVGIFTTAFVEPNDMGVIQSVLLISSFLGFLQLGTFNGLNRNLAFYKAQNKNDLVQDMVNTTYSVSFIVAFIGFIVAVCVLIYFICIGASIAYVLSSILLMVLLITSPISAAIETTYRSGQEYRKLGVIKNVESTVYLISGLAPVLWGYVGKIISEMNRYIVSIILRVYKRPYHQTGIGSIYSFILLVKTGFPILISGYIWTVYVSSDRIFIALYLTPTDLGLYTLSSYVTGAVMVLPTAVNQLLYPKASTRYGITQNRRDLRSFWKLSLVLYVAMLIPICTILYFLIPSLVPILMPKYIGGIKAAQYSLLTAMTAVSNGPGVIFGTLRRNKMSILFQVLALVGFWAWAFVFSSQINSIEDVALLRFAFSFILMLSTLYLTYKYVSC